MADEPVCFTGSSAEEIEQAKMFWKSIYPPVKPKSALVVKGVDHRLRTAQKPKNGVNYAHQSIEYFKAQETDPALDRFKQDAEKQRILEETQYAEKMQGFKRELQTLNQKRKQERVKKEEISSKVMQRTHDCLIQLSDSDEDDEDGRQAMDDIEKFEAKLRQQEKLKPS